ncbi:MAG: hypothetical protein AB7P04_09600 [Bacteriovoracia bacterium]
MEDLLNPDDFKSITLKIGLKNITTNTEVGGHLKDPKKRDVQLVEFLEQGLSVEVPVNTGARGHHVLLKVETEGATPNLVFEATAKIDELENLNAERAQLSLTLIQYEEEHWERLQKTFSSRQDDILAFFEAVKG